MVQSEEYKIDGTKIDEKASKAVKEYSLWQQGNSWFSPPTIKDITGIVYDIVGMATCQKWFSYADDGIFALIDLARGHKSAQAIGLDLATTAVNSFYWNGSDGKIDFNTDGFKQGITSGATIGSALGAGITAGLTEATVGKRTTKTKDASGKTVTNVEYTKVKGFNSNQINAIQSFNSLAGGLTSSIIGYAVDGTTTINILNTGDFGVGNTGLLELTIGDDGITSRIGTNGTNMSMGTIVSALNGIEHINKNNEINSYADENLGGKVDYANALRAQYGFGGDEQLQQLENIINESINTKVEEKNINPDFEKDENIKIQNNEREKITEDIIIDTQKTEFENKNENESNTNTEYKNEKTDTLEKNDVLENFKKEEKQESVNPVEKVEQNQNWISNVIENIKNGIVTGIKAITTETKDLIEKIKDNKPEKTKQKESDDLYNELNKKYEKVKEAMYDSDQSKENYKPGTFIPTEDSEYFNCIGFYCYLNDMSQDWDVRNFNNYKDFELIYTGKEIPYEDLLIDDAICLIGDEVSGSTNDHIMSYAKNGYVWECTPGSEKYETNVRYQKASCQLNAYKNPKKFKDYSVKIYRRKVN